MRTRSDEQVRRDVLIRGGFRPAEVDSWLAAHPKPSMLAEQTALLGERGTDLVAALCLGFRLPALARRLGMQPRQWVKNREEGPGE